jgi:predicted acyltransferase
MKATAPAESLADFQPTRGYQPAPQRNTAVDAYRGFVMLLMMAEVLQLSRVAQLHPGSWFWSFLASQQTHVEWSGCSLHDTIQPGFSFLVGVALPYSMASRLAKGARFGEMFRHALWRSLVLIALGIFLRSMDSTQTYFTFEDTLTQIGLGYPFLFLLGFRPPRWQWVALGAVVFGYWLAWALYPIGTPPDWPHNFAGFAAHWNKDVNLGNAFDQWFLNLFPRTQPYVANSGGYLTLSFIPTLGTMILGLAAGRWLREYAPRIPMKLLLGAGATGIASALALHFAGICPIVKRIWTPSWTLFSGGICFFFLAGFCWLMEVKAKRRWAFPLIVIGMNSIAAYVIAEAMRSFIQVSLRIHMGHAFRIFGTNVEAAVRGMAVLVIYWLILWWLYRRQIFLRV